MATYLPGVTDYIPQIQPFKPDYNFYANILQTKEAQYKAGYDKLSNIYGTLLNSEMLRDDNINRRTEFFSNIDNQIKKIAGLDLSKQQNISAAQKVFQPLIDDKYIQKDMAFTRVWRGQQERGKSLKNCTDPDKCGGEWWDGGDRALNYQAEDFRNATADESLSFTNPSYTPYVNTYKKAMDFAKDMGFDTKRVTFSADGRFIITTKNGPEVIPDLTKAFVSYIASDPKAVQMYKTQGYLDRKDYITENTEKFGSAEAAEMDYLNTAINEINENQKRIKEQAEEEKKEISRVREIANNVTKERELDEITDASYIEYLNGLDGQEKIADDVTSLATETLNQTKGAENLDLMSMRYRVDNARANDLLYSDMANHAYQYAMNTMEQEIDVNKYALAGYEHSLRSAEISQKAQYDAMLKQMDNDNKWNNTLREKLLDYYIEWGELPEDLSLFGINTGGRQGDYGNDYGLKGPDFNEKGTQIEQGPGGTSLIPASKFSESQLSKVSNDYTGTAQQLIAHTYNGLQAIIKSPNSSPAEVEQAKKDMESLLGYGEVVSETKMSPELQKANEDFQNNSTTGLMGAATAGMGATLLAAGAANVWNPIGWGLLLAGVGTAAYGYYSAYQSSEDIEKQTAAGGVQNIPVSKNGFINPNGGALLDARGSLTATDPNAPYNLNNVITNLQSYAATKGKGLFANNDDWINKSKLINAALTTTKQMKDAAFTKALEDNKNIKTRMVGLYGSDDGTELFIADDGHKLSREEFYQAYAQKYEPSLLEGETSGLAELGTVGAFTLAGATGGPIGAGAGFLIGSIFNAFVDDMDDIYDEAEERYNRIYDRGEVSGLGIGINAINGGSANQGQANRTFTFDSGRPGPVKQAIASLYQLDIVPALSNPASKGAAFMIGDASEFTKDETVFENNPKAANIMGDIFKHALSTRWKKDNDKRPIFEVNRVGTTLNDPNFIAATITLDADYISQNAGTKDKHGPTWDLLQSGQNKISAVFNKKFVSSPFFTSIEPTPVEFILNTTGSYTIDAYKDLGGYGYISKDINTGSMFWSLSKKQFNPETGELESVSYTSANDDFDPTTIAEGMNLELSTQDAMNTALRKEYIKNKTNE
jgi:hypothetical protein